jgi:hypothetical protein
MCPESEKNVKKADVLLCTHGHGDHIGNAVEVGKKHNSLAVGIFELCLWLKSKGVKQISPMNKGGTQTVAGVKVTMVHAVHSCGIQDGDQIIYGGEACGYVLEFSNGVKIYHAGDTNFFSDMAIIRDLRRRKSSSRSATIRCRRAKRLPCKLLEPKPSFHALELSSVDGTPAELQAGVKVLEMKPGKQLPVQCPQKGSPPQSIREASNTSEEGNMPDQNKNANAMGGITVGTSGYIYSLLPARQRVLAEMDRGRQEQNSIIGPPSHACSINWRSSGAKEFSKWLRHRIFTIWLARAVGTEASHLHRRRQKGRRSSTLPERAGQ